MSGLIPARALTTLARMSPLRVITQSTRVALLATLTAACQGGDPAHRHGQDGPQLDAGRGAELDADTFEPEDQPDGGQDDAGKSNPGEDGGAGDGGGPEDAGADAHVLPGPVSDWAISLKAAESALATDVAVAQDGSLYLTGTFRGKGTLGSTSGAGVTLESPKDSSAGFLAHLDSAGVVQWAVLFDGPPLVRAEGVAVLPGGGAVVTGDTSGPLACHQTQGEPLKTFTRGGGMFLARYDATGKAVWVVGADSEDSPWGSGEDVAVSGNSIYVGGMVGGTTHILSTVGSGTTLESDFNGDALFARYDLSGALKWAQRVVTADYGMVEGIVASKDAVYVAGHFRGPSTFESTSGATQDRDSLSYYEDAFAARYDTDGKLAWVRQIGKIPDLASYLSVKGLALSPDGNLQLVAAGAGNGRIPPVKFETIGDDVEVQEAAISYATYEPNGKLVRAVALGMVPTGLTAPDDTLVTGYFWDEVELPSTSGLYTLTSADKFDDAFMASWDAAGKLTKSKALGGQNQQRGYRIAAHARAYYVVGSFEKYGVFAGKTFLDTAPYAGFLLSTVR